MFKSARWRSDKNKIKAVFKLQFQATQVPQLGWETLMVSLVPMDVGKPTVKLEKVAIKDGTCRWENPIYVTIKFVQDLKSGKLNGKIYQFLVINGSSKAGLLGEASLDFAEYAETIKPSSVSLPLKTSNTGAILHVTVQRMHGSSDQRDVEENGDVAPDRSLRNQIVNDDTDDCIMNNSTEDEHFNNPTSKISESKGNLGAVLSSDASPGSGSESSSERNTPQELGLKNTHQDPTSMLSSLSHTSEPQKPMLNVDSSNHQEHRRSNTEWSVFSAPDGSLDGSTGSEDTLLKGLSLGSDISIEKLKNELVVLARQAELSELELQTLRKQIVKESKRGQELSREVVGLKEERDELKRQCEQLSSSKKRFETVKSSSRLQFDSEDPRALLEEIRQELNHEKDLNANLRLQLQKTQESNSELLLAVQDLDEMLELKNREITLLPDKVATSEKEEKLQAISRNEMDEDEDQRALEVLVRKHDNSSEAYLLEQKIMDLYSDIEVYRKDRDELEMQMEQLALDYEILKQENHDISLKLEQSQLQEKLKMQYDYPASFITINELESQVESLEKELKMQTEEHSTCLATIKELEFQVKTLEEDLEKQAEGFESQVESLEKELKMQTEEHSTCLATIKELEFQVKTLEEDLEKQAEGFEADLEAMTRSKVEQEQRAIRAEEALRKTRWNNANTAERLQEEFRQLSIQMASAFDANEKLAKKALKETSELRQQKAYQREMLDKTNKELGMVKVEYEAKLEELSKQVDVKTKEAEQMRLQVECITAKLEHQKKQGEERSNAFTGQITNLRNEIERLTKEHNTLEEKAEHLEELRVEKEQLKTSIGKTDMLLQKGNAERDELQRRITSLTMEAGKRLEELDNIKCLKDEKEEMVRSLHSEVENLKARYNDLKHSLSEEEQEKENLKKQIFHLRADLRKEDDDTVMEKKLKENSGRVLSSDGPKLTSRNNKSAPVSRGSKEVANLREKIKLLEGQIKKKEAALEKSTSSFSEREKDLCNKIEELEGRMEELSQNSTIFCGKHLHKEALDAEKANPNARKCEEGTNLADQNGTENPFSRNNGTSSEQKQEVVPTYNRNQEKLSEFLELELLREKKQSMEEELKEMQERYSEISLKFAEVEGERQQLVMTVRNLKNALKN